MLIACSGPNAESYYAQGRQLREADEPIQAMKAFIAATRVSSSEYSYIGRSYSNMATMCRISERHDLAYELYERSAQQFLQAKDTSAYAFALNNMAWEQAVRGNKELANTLVDSAISVCPSKTLLAKVPETQAAACLYAGEYDSTLYYTEKVPMESTYFDILRAQAYTFIEEYDSALYYAQRVLAETNNPRYLDDVYYILTQCDSTANTDALRNLAATRTDIQRNLERNRTDWIEATQLAQKALQPEQRTMRWLYWLLTIILIALSIGLFFLRRRIRRTCLEQQCRILRRSKDLRSELQWNNYTQFCTVCNTRLSGIADKLIQRDFSEREIRICVLVLIGLSYAEMAEILYRAESGIGKDKYVIAKHLGVSAKDLQKTLRHIANER